VKVYFTFIKKEHFSYNTIKKLCKVPLQSQGSPRSK